LEGKKKDPLQAEYFPLKKERSVDHRKGRKKNDNRLFLPTLRKNPAVPAPERDCVRTSKTR